MREVFSYTAAADLLNLPVILDGVSVLMASNGWKDDEISDAALATDEAVTNIILHGYRAAGGEVRLLCIVTGTEVTISIEDDAPQFDPTKYVPAKTTGPLPERGEGGLGIILIRNVMDEISYEFRDGKNVLTMRKRKG